MNKWHVVTQGSSYFWNNFKLRKHTTLNKQYIGFTWYATGNRRQIKEPFNIFWLKLWLGRSLRLEIMRMILKFALRLHFDKTQRILMSGKSRDAIASVNLDSFMTRKFLTNIWKSFGILIVFGLLPAHQSWYHNYHGRVMFKNDSKVFKPDTRIQSNLPSCVKSGL